MNWLSYLHLVAPADSTTIGWFHMLYAVFVLALVGTSLAINKFLTATVILVDVGLVLISIGAFGSIDAATKLGAASRAGVERIVDEAMGHAVRWTVSPER